MFRHEALLYSGEEEFVDSVAPFVREAVSNEEPILVAVAPPKIEALTSALGEESGSVMFADMFELGRNPGRIISAWHDFLGTHASEGERIRGIGEPIWPERAADELAESERHEALLNLAFADVPNWWLLCPYNTTALSPGVIERALINHPYYMTGSASAESATYAGLETLSRPFDLPLGEPDVPPIELSFEASSLDAVRRVVEQQAEMAGFTPARRYDLVLAVNEIASNSVRHGGGMGTLRVWVAADGVVCEVRDRGVLDKPLAGRMRPTEGQEGGLGLWIANQLCDLVQIRALREGTVVRLKMSRQ